MKAIDRLDLTSFKGFERFTLHLSGKDALLVGPNNAGKSTAVAALRAATNMLRIARARTPDGNRTVDGSLRPGWFFNNEQVQLVDENLRHEFRPIDTRLKLVCGDAELIAVWPADEPDDSGFVYCTDGGVVLRRPKEIRQAFPRIGLVPVLSPVEQQEESLTNSYVRSSAEGPVASRHFRNHLRIMDETPIGGGRTLLDQFREFAEPWLPQMTLRGRRHSYAGARSGLDLLYCEESSPREKEIFWAGDGIQIWLQLLAYFFRNEDRDVMVLDEPEVFLHPDLQRRLVTLIEQADAQVILATHSAEMLAEAPQDSIVWVSRTRKRATRSPGPEIRAQLSEAIGSHFNLRLARALRSRRVLFVEGKDIKILRVLARTIGTSRIAAEDGIAVIQLDGFDRWEHVEPFQWLLSNLLEDAVRTTVVLDRDYRTDEDVKDVVARLDAVGVEGHVWEAHELENYVIKAPVIARLAKAPLREVEVIMAKCIAAMEPDFLTGVTTHLLKKARRTRQPDEAAIKEGQRIGPALWADKSRRVLRVPGKELLSAINTALQAANHKAVAARNLAQRMRETEIDAEVKSVLSKIETGFDGSV
ncbi:MAG: hypothetical protein V7607_3867 [Solirubrobacteraceae bacterium]